MEGGGLSTGAPAASTVFAYWALALTI